MSTERFELSTGYEGATFTDTARDESAGECSHGESAGIHTKSDGTVEPWCPQCRYRGFITLTKESTNA